MFDGHQVKLRLPKLLKGVGRRTIQRVILQKLDEGLGIPSLVSAEVPFWTEDLQRLVQKIQEAHKTRLGKSVVL